MGHLLNILDLSVEEIDQLIATADAIMENPEDYQNACQNKILATLFFEPSTRTRLSFESAMLGLGGRVLGFSDSSSSSARKGESVADTIAVVSAYADIIAMRHPKEGAPLIAANHTRVPIINGGDGGHWHPTQTLTDLLTIRHEKGRLEGLTIGLCGDLKFGRTVHSLIEAMSRYDGVRFVLISPQELALPALEKARYIDGKGIPCRECRSLEEAIGELDILYMTRIQRERFASEEEYQRLKDSYILTPEKMELARGDMIVMHPLPRVNEIAPQVDEDPRACYFRQAYYGRYIRMALILKLLQESGKGKAQPDKGRSHFPENALPGGVCKNPHCITTTEQGLPQRLLPTGPEGKSYRCLYCEAEYTP
ncbi:MAG: aspartate carbamoyltransferase [Angelakisella sp.]|jgi:aspartate carbamoyltransferase catalytic subunit|nr:aspartate carbamoyltransferase [Angelakisella sp.]